MKSKYWFLLMVSMLWANSTSEFDFEDEFLPNEKNWSIGLAGGVSSDSSASLYRSLHLAYNMYSELYSVNLTAITELGFSAYVFDEEPFYTLEPVLRLGAYTERTETEASLWMSQDISNTYTYYGFEGQSLYHLMDWEKGSAILGPTIDMSIATSTQTYLGGVLILEHLWENYAINHGPMMQVAAIADMSSESTTSKGKGMRPMDTWSTSYLDASYGVNWISASKSWSIGSSLGYTWNLGSVRPAKSSTESVSTSGLWMDARVTKWW